MSTTLPVPARSGSAGPPRALRLVLSFGLALGLALTLSVATDVLAPAPADAATKKARKATNRKVLSARSVAMNQRGDAYSYGAAGPHRFDCSGLTYYSFRKAGFSGMPRTSSAQAQHTRRIKRGQMRRGDLMFFFGGSGVYHVGVFVGWKNGRRLMVHSPGSGRRVTVAHPWTGSWFPGTLRRR